MLERSGVVENEEYMNICVYVNKQRSIAHRWCAANEECAQEDMKEKKDHKSRRESNTRMMMTRCGTYTHTLTHVSVHI